MDRRNPRPGRLGLLALLLGFAGCGPTSPAAPPDDGKSANRLAKETSPYLLLHAHNPVELVSLGPRGVREGQGREEADLPVGRLQLVLLVPRDGARKLRGRRDRPVPQRPFRLRQGRPRGAPGRQPDLHDGLAGDRAGRRRLADVDVPHARRPPVLRRDVPPASRPRRFHRVPRADHRDLEGLGQGPRRDREVGRRALGRGAESAPRREGPAWRAALAGLGGARARRADGAVRSRLRRVRLQPATPAGPSSPNRPTSSS